MEEYFNRVIQSTKFNHTINNNLYENFGTCLPRVGTKYLHDLQLRPHGEFFIKNSLDILSFDLTETLNHKLMT